MLMELARYMPWYQGPDWPSASDLSLGWMMVALLVSAAAGVCWVQFGTWRRGQRAVSAVSRRAAIVRWTFSTLVLLAGTGLCCVWLLHTNGSYGGS
jgi:uncharacterized membrane protein